MPLNFLKTKHFFHPNSDEPFYSLLESSVYPWEILSEIASFIDSLGPLLSHDLFDQIGENIWVSRSATIADYATIKGPTIICENVEVRPGAYIRGNVYIGSDSVVGNSSELKNVLLLGRVDVPHFNYIGDSILSYGAHMGAGSITSNLRADRENITVRMGSEKIDTGLRKFGAMIAENVEVGCNAVLNPGVCLGANSVVYPLSCVRVSVPPDCIHKHSGELVSRV